MEGDNAVALFLDRQPDSVRWMPASSPVAPLRPLVAATWDWDTSTARLEGMILSTSSESGRNNSLPSPLRVQDDDVRPSEGGPSASTVVCWNLPARCSGSICMVPVGEGSRQALLLAGTEEGDIISVVADTWELCSRYENSQSRRGRDSAEAPQQGKVSASLRGLHQGRVAAVDFQGNSADCLTAGEDGKLLISRLEEGGRPGMEEFGMPDGRDMAGGLAYSCAKWLSPTQAVSFTLGGGVKWWDRRQSKAQPSAACPLAWHTVVPGAITSCHVHPSRQHLLVAGGSSGTLIAWDLRSISSPLLLSGTACQPRIPEAPATTQGRTADSTSLLSTADVLDVHFDPLLHLGDMQRPRIEAAKLPPVLACTADGCLSLLADGSVSDLFVGTSAVVSFDVEPDFGQHLICALDHGTLGYLHRARIF